MSYHFDERVNGRMCDPVAYQVKREVGLGEDYNWYNGSPACVELRRTAIEKLPAALEKMGLTLSEEWKQALEEADRADQFEGVFGSRFSTDGYSEQEKEEATRRFNANRSYRAEGNFLTNTWRTILLAAQDAIFRNKGEAPLDVSQCYPLVFSSEAKAEWERRRQPIGDDPDAMWVRHELC